MARVWRTLTLNINVTTLIARDLIPKPTSTLSTGHWRKFLSCLWNLEIRMWSKDDDAGRRLNTLLGYTRFEDHLGDYFFQHATKLKSLLPVANEERPFGYVIDDNRTLPLITGTHVLGLRHLQLWKTPISRELVDVILSPNTKLGVLELHNCHAESYSELSMTGRNLPIQLVQPNLINVESKFFV
ncbi:hypothetical protein GGR51DRAFT_577851 [Nemania sp. FL0031]|nr:hypothetical protein GGR51DRAFT_577851 [Nemania sp. FL0031]